MSVQADGSFVLESHDLDENGRLKRSVYLDCAQHPVVFFLTSALINFADDSGRRDFIYDTLSKKFPGASPSLKAEFLECAKSIAKNPDAMVVPIEAIPLPHRHNGKLANISKKIDALNEPDTIYLSTGLRWGYFVGDPTIPFANEMLEIPSTSVVVIEDHLTNLEALSSTAGLPVSYFKKNFKDSHHSLMIDLHEAAHLLQIKLQVDSDPIKHNNEIIADMAAGYFLEKAGYGQTPATISLQARYTSFLDTDNDHRIAPSIDTMQKGEKPLPLAEIKSSAYFMRSVLWEAAREQFTSTASAKEQKASIWQKNISRKSDVPSDSWDMFSEQRKPEMYYSLLRKMTNKGAFRKDPLAQRIAVRMIEAAEYFCPAISKEKKIEIPNLQMHFS